jgi:hypothetical protein
MEVADRRDACSGHGVGIPGAGLTVPREG